MSRIRINNYLAQAALFFFGIALWHKSSVDQAAYNFLLLVWLLNGGLQRLWQVRKEPLVIGIFTLIVVFSLGLLWAAEGNGQSVFSRFSILLVFIPYWLLLSKERLLWAAGGIAVGFASMLGPVLYASLLNLPVPVWSMTYITASMLLGSAALLTIYAAFRPYDRWLKALFLLPGASMLFLQSLQNARGALLSTLIALLLMVVLWNLGNRKRLLGFALATTLLGGGILFFGDKMQQRIKQGVDNLEKAQKGNYQTSLGYRLAIWDVGWQSLKEKPFFGQGTGMAATYFDQKTQTYKKKQYRNLPRWLHTGTYHYHNDLIEIGVHTGLLGITAFILFLAGWFETLRRRGLWREGAVMISFFVLLGMTDVLFIYRWMIYLFLVLTAIALFVHSKEETARA